MFQMFATYASKIPSTATSSQLNQLDDFSLMCILDYLDFDDLIAVAKLSPRLSNIILDHYLLAKFRLHEKNIIYLKERLFYNDRYGISTYLADDWDETLTILELFGHAFKHVCFKVPSQTNPRTLVVFEYADKYFPQAIKKIEIIRVDAKALAKWTHTVNCNITEVEIGGHVIDPIPLNDLFPLMQKLEVLNIHSSMIQFYPHLTNCRASIGHLNTFELIRLNPQLRQFRTVKCYNVSEVRYLSEISPNLESLDVYLYIDPHNIDSDVAHFRNVKEFSLTALNEKEEDEIPEFWNVIGNIQFDRLEVLKLEAVIPNADNRLIEMIAANRNLKKFETNVGMTPETFNSLLQSLPELKEVSIKLNARMRNLLEGFLVIGNHGLRRINLDACNGLRVEDFGGNTTLNWQIVKMSQYRFSFIRKY